MRRAGGRGGPPRPPALAAALGLAALLLSCAHAPAEAPRAFPDLEVAEVLAADAPLPPVPFRLSQVPGDVLVLEFFSSRCATCQRQAPELDRAARTLAAEEGGRVRVLAVGAGDRASDLEAFRADYGASYALVPDPWYDLYGRLGSLPRPPVTFFLRREPGGWRQAGVLRGHAAAPEIVARARGALAGEALASPKPERSPPPAPPLGLDETGQRALALALLRRLDPGVARVEAVDLGGGVSVFRGLSANGEPAGLYARLASREPPCDVCHAAHFLLAFDRSGEVRGFEPIHVSKAGNVPLRPEEAKALERRLVGRGPAGLSFDPAVDAVTGATLSASIIFDEARRTAKLLAERAGR